MSIHPYFSFFEISDYDNSLPTMLLKFYKSLKKVYLKIYGLVKKCMELVRTGQISMY